MAYQPFIKAVPVWASGRETEMNVTLRFTAKVPAGETFVRMTGSSLYRMFANGRLVAYGPARGPKCFFRVDEETFCFTEETRIVFEVAGYNINSYYLFDQPSFFQCEILQNNAVIAYTAPKGGMKCDVVTERVQKVQKYSFQRTFTEVWRLGRAYAASFTEDTPGRCPLSQSEEKVYLSRNVPFATLADLRPVTFVTDGTFIRDSAPSGFRDRSLVGISPIQKGYLEKELELCLTETLAGYHYEVKEPTNTPIEDDASFSLPAESFITLKFKSLLTGFIAAHIKITSPSVITFLFDEIYTKDVDFTRIGCVNAVRYELAPGEYDLLSMEPYTVQYLKILCEGCTAEISGIRLVEYSAPDSNFISYRFENEKLNKIWDAAVQTYRQNAVDLYTDCPSRERAGWLCDSFWTARTEYALTGKSVVEKNFLENFLLPEEFECLPKGMFPMCYPSDHYNGNYIPNWAMWLVLELEEYQKRSGDTEMIEAFRDKIYDLFTFLDGYLNQDGLLEKLDAWVFIEWSTANQYVQDVNFPSNMLYAACKKAAGRLFGDEGLIMEGEVMQETIRRMSYNGKFFTDHLVYNDAGELVNPGEATEVCQYYAFYLGTATPETYPELWDTMVHDFGPYRKENNKYPEIAFANAFIGNYLRLDMMAKNGRMDEVLENIEGYFYKMSEITGTLWEKDTTSASVDHGFASHVLVWLKQAADEKLIH